MSDDVVPEVSTTESPAPAADPAVTPPAAAVAQPAPAAIDYSALTVPDAIKEDAFVSAVRGLAEKHQAPLELAQGVLDAIAAEAKASADSWTAQRETWRNEVLADAAIGETGKAHAATFLDTYGDAETRKLLDDTGLGDHPLIVRLFAKAGKDAGPAPIVPSNGAVTADPLRLMYPNSPMLWQ